MNSRIGLSLVIVAAMVLQPVVARAHFLWLVPLKKATGNQLHLYFGERAEPDDPDLLDRVADPKVRQIRANEPPRELKLAKGSESLVAELGEDSDGALFALSHDWGVISRGGDTFLLRYHAKTGPVLGDEAWTKTDCGKYLLLDIIPERIGDKVRVSVKWHGAPIAGAEVKVQGPGIEDFEATSDSRGQASFAVKGSGVYSIRARHIEDRAGTIDDDNYTSIRHYATLALAVPSAGADLETKSEDSGITVSADKLPAIPETVTSFGAAISGDALYVYGGHTGRAHAYSDEAQAKTLRRLDLRNPKAWESLGQGPGLQGLAMVAHGGKLYRIGGFIAKNKEGEDHELWSQASVARFDTNTGQWSDLSPLPEPRSSFDAAVLGDQLYVIGGWKLAGDADNLWHKSAYVLDLGANNPQWKALPEPPFQRRALSVAAHQGKIYAIGGMQEEGGPTTRVDIFDPATGKWSLGPNLQGDKMDGFGSSAFAVGGQLFATTHSGKLQRLSDDGKSWEVVKQLDRARFFHRMLPVSPTRLISVGGASMSVGKFEEIDVIDLSPSNPEAASP